MKMNYKIQCLERQYSLGLLYFHTCPGCARHQALNLQAISQVYFWRLRNEVMLLPSLNQRSGWLTDIKVVSSPNSVFLSWDTCVGSIWVYHVAKVRVRGRKNQCKSTDTLLSVLWVLCFSPETLMSSADIHEIVTG